MACSVPVVLTAAVETVLAVEPCNAAGDNTDMQTRKKPKKKLTPLQENRLLKIYLLIVSVLLLWLLLAPGTGVFGLLKLRQETVRLEQQTQKLINSNEELRAEIDRLKNDPDYLERIAREKYGLLKKNEQMFDFSRSGNDDSPD
jgi:cell division protein FtsB